MTTNDHALSDAPPRRFSGLQVLAICVAVIVLSVAITSFVVWRYVFPSRFDAVELSQSENRELDQKIAALGFASETSETGVGQDKVEREPLAPKAYSEDGARREVSLSERELNALLARNTSMADRLAIDLADNLASARLLVPLDPDFPLLGGKTLRVNAGLEVAFRAGRPVAVLRGVSLMGVPLPNAWLGNLKNVDLIAQFGSNPGFWKTFADGIEHIEVRDGQLMVKLKE